MKIVLQRVSEASVQIDNKIIGKINFGYLILLGIGENDSEEDITWLVKKIINLRVFSDNKGKMNLSIKEVDGDILLISQFTLYASTKKGNRPSFITSASPEFAIPLYEKFIMIMKNQLGQDIETGEFGADMKISSVNDGPVTIIIDSKNKE
jgi:D-tyrosyl-tRNA(Tyr) deacylase